MTVLDRIPALDEGALVAVERNARRWVSAGTDAQKSEAETVLLAIATERLRRAAAQNSGSPSHIQSDEMIIATGVGFPAIWMNIIQRVDPGDTIRNWGLASGYTGGAFKIEDVGNSTISVTGSSMSQTRVVSKGDFEKVYAVWAEYCAGNYPRAKMTNLSQNTTYILSILRHVTSR